MNTANQTLSYHCQHCGFIYDPWYWQECPNCGKENDIDDVTLRQLYF